MFDYYHLYSYYNYLEQKPTSTSKGKIWSIGEGRGGGQTKVRADGFPFENLSESRTCITVIHLPLVEKARYWSHGERKINLVVITPSWSVSVIFHFCNRRWWYSTSMMGPLGSFLKLSKPRAMEVQTMKENNTYKRVRTYIQNHVRVVNALLRQECRLSVWFRMMKRK